MSTLKLNLNNFKHVNESNFKEQYGLYIAHVVFPDQIARLTRRRHWSTLLFIFNYL